MMLQHPGLQHGERSNVAVVSGAKPPVRVNLLGGFVFVLNVVGELSGKAKGGLFVESSTSTSTRSTGSGD